MTLQNENSMLALPQEAEAVRGGTLIAAMPPPRRRRRWLFTPWNKQTYRQTTGQKIFDKRTDKQTTRIESAYQPRITTTTARSPVEIRHVVLNRRTAWSYVWLIHPTTWPGSVQSAKVWQLGSRSIQSFKLHRQQNQSCAAKPHASRPPHGHRSPSRGAMIGCAPCAVLCGFNPINEICIKQCQLHASSTTTNYFVYYRKLN